MKKILSFVLSTVLTLICILPAGAAFAAGESTISPGKVATVELNASGEMYVIHFTPNVTGNYRITSHYNTDNLIDPYCFINDSKGNPYVDQSLCDDTYYENGSRSTNFDVTAKFNAGDEYTIICGSYSQSYFPVTYYVELTYKDVVVEPVAKPDAPTGFDVTGTGNQGTLLYLDWEDSANAQGYRMYVVSGDKEYYKGEVTESMFKFTDLTAGWNYSLRIEAFNSAGTASTETTICAAPAPMTADDITLSTSGSKLNVSWEKQTCTGYVVQWSTDSSFKNIAGTKYIDKPWNTSYSVTISNPQNYYVRVRAYKTYNGMTSYGDFSPAVKEKVLPGTITGFDIIGTGNKGSLLYLDWNGMANTDGYKVYVVSGEKEYLKGTTTDSQFKFTDLTPGWNYTVKVVAYNADGETATTTTICAAPATMTTDDFAAKASGNKLNISWDKQTCTGYVVQWSTDSSFKNITGTKYIDKPWNTSYSVSVSNPQNYYVRVRAYKTYNGMTAYGDFSPAEKAVK